jgi:ribosomal protein S18 acetylase RimI-like enzyme
MSHAVSLRECTADDASTLAIIAAATLLEAFAGFIPGDALLAHCAKNHFPGAYTAYLEKPQTRAWLAEVEPGAAPVGYAMLTAPDFPAELVKLGDIELRRIYLFSRFHGDGVGQRMIDTAVAGARQQAAKRLLLGVHPGNKRALAFYRRNGFAKIGVRTFQVGASTFEDPVLAREL